MNPVLIRLRVVLVAVIGFALMGWDVAAQASAASPRMSRKDSLWQVWNDTSQPDTNRLKAIQALTWPMLTKDLDSVFLLASRQLDFARQVNNDRWIGKALYNIATHYYYKGI